MNQLTELKPQRVFYYFGQISAIPRGSGNTKAISDYLVSFAQNHGLKYVQDEVNNVIIYKDASSGYEQSQTVILQGHMDMVCEKNIDCRHDFLHDGIELIVEGDCLRANATTLGGDDGIALAYALAVLEDDQLQHPALEAVFTVDEEVGMDGAKALDVSLLQGTRLLNIDSEEEGILWASCAGGVRCQCCLPLTYDRQVEQESLHIVVKGLQGGHSGTEIDKGRVNANTLIGRLLYVLQQKIDFRICHLQGGMKDNAIPREAQATLTGFSLSKEEVMKFLEEQFQIIKKEQIGREPGLELEIQWKKEICVPVSAEQQRIILFWLMNLPDGVQQMSQEIEGLVETSLNMGVMRMTEEAFVLDLALRSSVGSAKEYLKEKVVLFTEYTGGQCLVSGDYPAWEYRKESQLRKICAQAYDQLFHKKLDVQAMHAGLECGILTDKLKNTDCVSFGPDIMDIHTPKERMSISSVERSYRFLLRILELLK